MKTKETRAGRIIAAALALACLSACQAANDKVDLGSVSGETRSGPVKKSEILGSGPVNVTMLLALSATGEAGDNGRKMRDAAALAMADMGDKQITLTVEDTGGDAGRAKTLAVKAMASGAKLVVGPAEQGAVRQLAAISGTKRPLVLALAENYQGSPGVYSFRLNEADSAAAGAAAVAEKGARKFVLFVADGNDLKTIEDRVRNSLSIYGASLVVALPFGPGGIDKAVTDMAALVDDPNAIVIASGSANPASLVAALKSKGILKAGVKLIGTNRWLDRPIDDPALQGAEIATLDGSEAGPIAARFKTTYQYEPDVNVAYGYDAIALAAGIAGALGPDGFQKTVIESPTGFRGSTGIFRLRNSGMSERSMPFYKIENGKLRKIASSISSF